jgi:maltokinase
MIAADDAGSLVDRLRDVDVRDLLPPRRADTHQRRTPFTLRDVLPLGKDLVLAVGESGDGFIVAPMTTSGRNLRRARAGDGAYEAIARIVREGAAIGRFRGVPLGAAAVAEGERAIDVDQSNDSVTIGDRAVVKLFPRTSAGPQPGMELLAHLSAVGFSAIPRPFGSLLWHDARDQSVVLATVAEFLPNARGGWDAYLEPILAWLNGGDRGDAISPAEPLGRLVASLHAALATPSDVLAAPTRAAGPSDLASWHAAARRTLAEALTVTSGDEGQRLMILADRAATAIDGLRAAGMTPSMRIHGDLHVGQVLRWTGGTAITDFDGNPLAVVDERVSLQSPASDVASFVRSLDHLGRIAQRRRPDRSDDVETWIEEVRGFFLSEYRAGLDDAGHADLFDGRLLRPFEVAQECHEYVYAATFLPRWGYVPDTAMPRLLDAIS